MRVIKQLWYKLSYIISYVRHVFKEGDECWDYAFLVALLRWKLKRMEASTQYWYAESADRTAKQLRYAIFLIDRWQDNDSFLNEVMREHEKKWGKVEMVHTPSKKLKGHYSVSLVYPNGDPDEAHEEFERLRKEDIRRKDDARRRLFRHLEKYIERWWD